MSNPIEAGGQNDKAGGNVENGQNQDNQDVKTVSFDTYTKLMDEKKARDRELAEFKAKEKERSLADLKAKEDFKQIAELKEAELKQTQAKLNEVQVKVENAYKLDAILKNVSGSIDEQYLGLIDLSKVAVNPDTGEVDVLSAQKAAKEFETKFPLVIKRADGNKLPTDAAQGSGAKLSYEQWLALPLAEMKKRQKDVAID